MAETKKRYLDLRIAVGGTVKRITKTINYMSGMGSSISKVIDSIGPKLVRESVLKGYGRVQGLEEKVDGLQRNRSKWNEGEATTSSKGFKKFIRNLTVSHSKTGDRDNIRINHDIPDWLYDIYDTGFKHDFYIPRQDNNNAMNPFWFTKGDGSPYFWQGNNCKRILVRASSFEGYGYTQTIQDTVAEMMEDKKIQLSALIRKKP